MQYCQVIQVTFNLNLSDSVKVYVHRSRLTHVPSLLGPASLNVEGVQHIFHMDGYLHGSSRTLHLLSNSIMLGLSTLDVEQLFSFPLSN